MSVVLPYFHPTSIVLIDDDVDFLNNLKETLSPHHSLCHLYSQPQQFLVDDSHNTYRNHLNDRIVTMDEDDDNLQYEPDIFIKEIMIPQRYEQVSVVVIDYNMPGTNGLEVCQQIENPYIKKILLTGAADENVAVDAFNKGLISQFIRKQDSQFLDRLLVAIQKCQYNYFHELLSIPLKMLATRYEGTALVDQAFARYFDQLIRDNYITEYYLVESMGSFLLINNQHKIYSLMTLDDDLIEIYLSSQSSDRLSPEHIRAIQQKELIPCYYHPFQKPNIETERLADYLRPPHIIQGLKRRYYSCFGQDFIPLGDAKIALI